MNIPNVFLVNPHFDIIGLHSETKPTDVKNGSTFYEVDTTDLYIFYEGTWYNQNLDAIESEVDG